MHEIHVTVKPTTEIAKFREVCGELGCKPIFIDLGTDAGTGYAQQLMTSSYVAGVYEAAQTKAAVIAATLETAGFVPIRTKIEGLMSCGPENDEGSYYEMHAKFGLHDDSVYAKLAAFAAAEGGHMSRNAFKRTGAESVRFVTWRFYGCGRAAAMTAATTVLNKITEFVSDELTLISCEKEYVMYDSNLECDGTWGQ